MIASFFQHLETTKVEYLLISGQATILYGAATFSEDVDIWVAPTEPNIDSFLSVLRAGSATYYKLTPPFTLENLERGHGFHFVLPDGPGASVYLDVMGKPPRVGTFAAAATNARTFDTDFGRVRVVGVRELVELKKTQRRADYPIIGRLALGYLSELATVEPDDLRWTLDNCFGLSEVETVLRSHASATLALEPSLARPLYQAAAEISEHGQLSHSTEEELDRFLDAKAAELRRNDRRYWAEIIDELRIFRRAGTLMTEGAPI
jgi:hypothetical protein